MGHKDQKYCLYEFTFIFATIPLVLLSQIKQIMPMVPLHIHTKEALKKLLNKLKRVYVQHFQWFSDNQFKENTDLCYAVANISENDKIRIRCEKIAYNECQKMVGINLIINFV